MARTELTVSNKPTRFATSGTTLTKNTVTDGTGDSGYYAVFNGDLIMVVETSAAAVCTAEVQGGKFPPLSETIDDVSVTTGSTSGDMAVYYISEVGYRNASNGRCEIDVTGDGYIMLFPA
jgi:hypothetical protein